MLNQLTSLDLQYVSPRLQRCENMELTVPGTYYPGLPLVHIQKIQSQLAVISSKQRPRRIVIFGSDGKEYQFLLKGHEDLRQDERVMQLFGLVNTLLINDPITFRRNLTIQRFSAIPLSTNSGLIGWIPHTDTLHALIRTHRERINRQTTEEHKRMQAMAYAYRENNLDMLTLMQKMEVFEYALACTTGDDLANILWYKAPSSEVWLERRTNYTRSLAVMSMVGYVLGLGDRHPSNLMLQRYSGKIIHIDFGDCFEVAQKRDKFPEKIPFRLTRMLILAMEVTRIHGNFFVTCSRVLNVLRAHRDNVMAVLEAFVHDPLLNWKLVEGLDEQSRQQKLEQYRYGGARVSTGGGVGYHGDMVNDGDQFMVETDQALSRKALDIINRVKDKLTGHDFVDERAHFEDFNTEESDYNLNENAIISDGGISKKVDENKEDINVSSPPLLSEDSSPTTSPQTNDDKKMMTAATSSPSPDDGRQNILENENNNSFDDTTFSSSSTTTMNGSHHSPNSSYLFSRAPPIGTVTSIEPIKLFPLRYSPHHINNTTTAPSISGYHHQHHLHGDVIVGINGGGCIHHHHHGDGSEENDKIRRAIKEESPLAVEEQVERLIDQATSNENLCQCYVGWCSFW